MRSCDVVFEYIREHIVPAHISDNGEPVKKNSIYLNMNLFTLSLSTQYNLQYYSVDTCSPTHEHNHTLVVWLVGTLKCGDIDTMTMTN